MHVRPRTSENSVIRCQPEWGQFCVTKLRTVWEKIAWGPIGSWIGWRHTTSEKRFADRSTAWPRTLRSPHMRIHTRIILLVLGSALLAHGCGRDLPNSPGATASRTATLAHGGGSGGE